MSHIEPQAIPSEAHGAHPAKVARLKDKRRVYQGHVITLERHDVEMANGHVLSLDVVLHPGAAAVVPLDYDNHVLLVEQGRYAAGEVLLEAPAGKRDNDESLVSCAQRELREEAGVKAERLDSLGTILTTPGFCNERIALYLARDLVACGQHLDVDEDIKVVKIAWHDALAMALDGRITDAKTVVALMRAQYVLTHV